MGEPKTKTTTDGGVPDGPAAAILATVPATPSAPLATVQALVAQGRPPAEIAAVIAANPGARAEILAYLHAARGNAFVQQVIAEGGPLFALPDIVLADAPPPPLPPPPTPQVPASMVVQAGGQYIQVYLSPDVTDQPNVFMFFHGQRANLGIQPGLSEPGDNVSGNDVAASAMAQGKAKNTIALLPQGVDGVKGGGGMPGLEGKGNDLPKFLDAILLAIQTTLKWTKPFTPQHIALAGHSAGGYMGVHEALSQAGRYNDTISDITLMDTNYSPTHFADASKWLYTGGPNKTLRIIQSPDQTNNSYNLVHDPKDTEHPKSRTVRERVDPYWRDYLGEGPLKANAKAAGMTINKLKSPTAADLEGKTKLDRGIVQHTQVLNSRSEVQCDIMIMMSTLGHHEIRDSVMDDAIDSIGLGAAGAAAFGTNQLEHYGRDVNAPHHGNAEGPFSAAELKEQEDERRREQAAKQKQKQQQQQPKQ
jgi:hypothetical protein